MGSVWQRLQRGGKRAARVRFLVTFEELLLEGGGGWRPHTLTVTWSRRGRRVSSKPHRWQPGIENPDRGMVVWVVPESIEVTVTLYQDPNATTYDDKEWNVLIENESRGRRSVVAGTPLDLGRLAGGPGGDPPPLSLSLSLRPRSHKVATAKLRLRLRSRVLRDGDPTEQDLQSLASLGPPGDVADLGDFESDPEDEDGADTAPPAPPGDTGDPQTGSRAPQTPPDPQIIAGPPGTPPDPPSQGEIPPDPQVGPGLPQIPPDSPKQGDTPPEPPISSGPPLDPPSQGETPPAPQISLEPSQTPPAPQISSGPPQILPDPQISLEPPQTPPDPQILPDPPKQEETPPDPPIGSGPPPSQAGPPPGVLLPPPGPRPPPTPPPRQKRRSEKRGGPGGTPPNGETPRDLGTPPNGETPRDPPTVGPPRGDPPAEPEPPEEEPPELVALQQQQLRVDARAVALERELRQLMDSGADPPREERLLQEWLQLLNQRNELLREQDRLQLLAQQQDLERRFERLNGELRGMLDTEERLKPPGQRQREQRLLQELVALVDERDRLLRDLDGRLRQAEEEDAHLQRSLGQRQRRGARKETCGIA